MNGYDAANKIHLQISFPITSLVVLVILIRSVNVVMMTIGQDNGQDDHQNEKAAMMVILILI